MYWWKAALFKNTIKGTHYIWYMWCWVSFMLWCCVICGYHYFEVLHCLSSVLKMELSTSFQNICKYLWNYMMTWSRLPLWILSTWGDRLLLCEDSSADIALGPHEHHDKMEKLQLCADSQNALNQFVHKIRELEGIWLCFSAWGEWFEKEQLLNLRWI